MQLIKLQPGRVHVYSMYYFKNIVRFGIEKRKHKKNKILVVISFFSKRIILNIKIKILKLVNATILQHFLDIIK